MNLKRIDKIAIATGAVVGSALGVGIGWIIVHSLKLFVVVYVFGHTAAAIGPLSMGMHECEIYALPYLAKIQTEGWSESVANGKAVKLPKVDGKTFRGPLDVVNRCEWHIKNPLKIGNSYGLSK